MATGRSRISGSTTDEAAATAGDVVETGRGGTSTAGRVLGAPATVAREVADDVAAAARRPETVLYWGGLAALALMGAIELPVAAAIGVGVAIASNARRSRSAV